MCLRHTPRLLDVGHFARCGWATHSGLWAHWWPAYLKPAVIPQSLCHRPRLVTRRTVVQTLVASVLLSTLGTAQAQMALSAAINRVARYRALSQRIAKAYVQMRLGVLPEQAEKVMATAKKLVRSGFVELASVPWPTELAQQVTEVHKSFDVLDALLVMPPTAKSVATVVAQAGEDYQGARQQLTSDADEFRQAMLTLEAAPLTTPAIREELAQGNGQWVFFSAALQRKADARGLADVATTSERLLEVTDRLTGLYDAALKQVLG